MDQKGFLIQFFLGGGQPNSDLEKYNGGLKVGRKHIGNGTDKEEGINHKKNSRLECRGMYDDMEETGRLANGGRLEPTEI